MPDSSKETNPTDGDENIDEPEYELLVDDTPVCDIIQRYLEIYRLWDRVGRE